VPSMAEHRARVGEEVRATVGDRILIDLPENASTGFQWSLVELPGCLSLDEDRRAVPDPPTPGAAATRHLVLRAVGTGSGRVLLELSRPWAPSEAEQRRTIDVTVS
jgi:inhibitor of cysteine peptidase